MFKKIISSMSVMLLAFCMNVNAQQLQNVTFGKIMPKAAPNAVTSNVELEPDEFWWGYFDGDFSHAGSLGMGQKTKIPQKYDAALCIEAGSAVGIDKVIKGVSFSFPSVTNISDVKIWISTELPESPEQANICCKTVDKLTDLQQYVDFMNEVRFDTPYEIDPSKDTYIGYSFVVNKNESDMDRYPIMVTGGSAGQHKKGLLVNVSSEKANWEDYEAMKFGDLALNILMSGKFLNDDASIGGSIITQTAIPGGNVILPLEIQNAGMEGISDFDLSIDIAGTKTDVHVTPESKITGISSKYKFSVEAKAPMTAGLNDVVVTMHKVNGKTNPNANNTARGKVIVVSRKVTHKVVVEEFTGMWCGYCPRGYFAMEKLADTYADKTVLVASHFNDILHCEDYVYAILPNQGAPSAHVDRTLLKIDPYYGTDVNASVPMGICKDIDKQIEVPSVAEVKADAVLDGDIITAKSEVNFLYTGEANYALAYVLTEDGMHGEGEDWTQVNYYAGQTSSDPNIQSIADMGRRIEGLIYNDVAIAAKGIQNGLKNSIPSSVTENETYKKEVTFNLKSYPVIQDVNKLKISVFLFDVSSGRIVNADCIALSNTASIEGVEAFDEASEEVARYTIDGHRIYTPEKGINIVRYSDGKVKKVFVR